MTFAIYLALAAACALFAARSGGYGWLLLGILLGVVFSFTQIEKKEMHYEEKASYIHMQEERTHHNATLEDEILVALHEHGLYSADMYDMILSTAAVESDYGFTSGNVFQVLPWVAEDMQMHWLKYKDGVHPYNKAWFGSRDYSMSIKDNLNKGIEFQTVACALHYLRTCELHEISLPKKGDTLRQAEFWKKYYNTYESNGRKEHFIKKKHMYVVR